MSSGLWNSCPGSPNSLNKITADATTPMLMQPHLSVMEKLQLAYNLVAEVLGQAPQLYDTHLDQALLVLVLAMKRARRSPGLRHPPHPHYQYQDLPF